MLLLHMQEMVFVDSQEGLLSSRGGGGGGGGQTYWHQAYRFRLKFITLIYQIALEDLVLLRVQ